jgi:hypothetical protein
MLGKLESDIKKIEKEAVLLFKSTTWEQKVSSAVTIASPFVEELAQLSLGTPAEQLVAGAVSIVKSDLLTVKTVVSGATAPTGATGVVAKPIWLRCSLLSRLKTRRMPRALRMR